MIELANLNDFALFSVGLAAKKQIDDANRYMERCLNAREAGQPVAKGWELVSIGPKGKRKGKVVGRAFVTWRNPGCSPYDVIERAEAIIPLVEAEFQRRYKENASQEMDRVAREREALLLSYGPDARDEPRKPVKKRKQKKSKGDTGMKRLI